MKSNACFTTWKRAVFVAAVSLAAMTGGNVMAQSPTSTTRIAEYRAREAEAARKVPQLITAWTSATEPVVRRDLAEKILAEWRRSSGNGGDNGDLEDTVTAIGIGRTRMPQAVLIDVRAKARQTRPPIKDFGTTAVIQRDTFTARRIARGAFEFWTEKAGWLFDERGGVTGHALLPDGHAGTYRPAGAFLPDGRWVTRGLDAKNPEVLVCNPNGDVVKRIRTQDLIGNKFPDYPAGPLVWSQADKDGNGWVLAVSVGHVTAMAWVGANGHESHPMRATEALARCYRHPLDSEGHSLATKVPSDDGELVMETERTVHGPGSFYTFYDVRRAVATVDEWENSDDLTNRLFGFDAPADKERFGFWPGQHSSFLTTSVRAGGAAESPRTWFLDPAGDCQGYLDGLVLADAADGSSLLIRRWDDTVLVLGNDLKCREARKYVGAGGGTVSPQALFDDLKIGLFIEDGKLELCAWE